MRLRRVAVLDPSLSTVWIGAGHRVGDIVRERGLPGPHPAAARPGLRWSFTPAGQELVGKRLLAEARRRGFATRVLVVRKGAVAVVHRDRLQAPGYLRRW